MRGRCAVVIMAGKGSCGVPERWTTYIPLGRRMPGTRFIAFKVPLNESFNRNLLPEERFSPHDLIRMVEERKEELGLIIDLSYTTRYYSRQELPRTLRYYKILTRGREIPNRKTIQRFKYYVKKFLTANKDNDKLIGVHCTHGLNRTGYLICRYLIDAEGMEPNAAIELFNTCRGHSIERANYLEDLQKRALTNCEVKNLGSDLSRSKGSAPAKPQKQLVKPPPHHPSQAPLAVPRNPGSGKKKQWPGPTAQEQPQELGHRHRALGQGQLQQKKLEQRQLKKLEHLEQRQQKKQGQQKWNHLEQDHLDQEKQMKQNHLEQRQWNHLEQRQQKKWNHLEQRKQNHLEQHHLEQRKQKWNHLEQNHLEQKQQNHLEQNHLEQRKQNHLEQNHLEQRQQNHLEQRKQNHLEQRKQNHLEQRKQNHLEQRKQNHLEQNHLEQRKQNQLEQNHLEQRKQNHLEQRQPCSLAPRNCWLSPPSKKKHKELLPHQSPQPCLPQEPSAARKRRHRKHRLGEEEMS